MSSGSSNSLTADSWNHLQYWFLLLSLEKRVFIWLILCGRSSRSLALWVEDFEFLLLTANKSKNFLRLASIQVPILVRFYVVKNVTFLCFLLSSTECVLWTFLPSAYCSFIWHFDTGIFYKTLCDFFCCVKVFQITFFVKQKNLSHAVTTCSVWDWTHDWVTPLYCSTVNFFFDITIYVIFINVCGSKQK